MTTEHKGEALDKDCIRGKACCEVLQAVGVDEKAVYKAAYLGQSGASTSVGHSG